MIYKNISSVFGKISRVPCYLIGSTQVRPDRKTRCDHDTISLGITLLIGTLLDYNAQFSKNAEVRLRNENDILAYVGLIDERCNFPFGELQSYLDSLDSFLMESISDESGFKASLVLKGLRTVVCHHDVVSFKRTLCRVFCGIDITEETGRDVLGAFIQGSRQVFTFLKKIVIARPDLEKEMHTDFFSFEEKLSSIIECQRGSAFYKQIVGEMNAMLLEHCNHFDIHPFVPKHGSGVVADTTQKTWLDKATMMCSDSRFAMLAAWTGLGSLENYGMNNPEKSNRTSRYITVPKSWKKLRGISAEPSELQYLQQGVMKRLDAMFVNDSWWAKAVNLHDQTRSRRLAMQGSIDGRIATVDLSAASDSVSLQLVKDVFKNTPLLKWLLATRSTHTNCNGTVVKTNKFAPMGSACCFPVECIVFTLAAKVACNHTFQSSKNSREVVVYGDDIILPTEAAPVLVEILSTLGFSINTDKSYWSGKFREACGVEAWDGHDVSTCKFKQYTSGCHESLVNYNDFTSLISLSNELLNKGLTTTRRFLTDFLFRKKLEVNGKHVLCNEGVVMSYDGARGTLASPKPDNFQLQKKFQKESCQMAYKLCVWTRKGCDPSKSVDNRLEDALYTEWLINHQYTEPLRYDYYVGLFGRSTTIYQFKELAEKVDRYARKSKDYQMVCKQRWVAQWSN